MRTQSAFLIALTLFCGPTSPCLALTPHTLVMHSHHAGSALLSKVASLEQTVFGQTSTLPLANRVARLEHTTFGHTQIGPLQQRLHILELALKDGRMIPVPLANSRPNQTAAVPSPAANAAPTPAAPSAPVTAVIGAPPPASATPANSSAAQAAPGNGQAVINLICLGIKAEALGKEPQAESDFQQALLLDPHNADAYFNLGVLREKQANYQQALSFYQSALENRPSDQQAAQAIETVKRLSSFNQTVPAPLQQPLALNLADQSSSAPGASNTAAGGRPLQGSVSDSTANAAGAGDAAAAEIESNARQTAKMQLAAAKHAERVAKIKRFGHEMGTAIGVTLKAAAVLAGTALAAYANSSVSYSSGVSTTSTVDTCACPTYRRY